MDLFKIFNNNKGLVLPPTFEYSIYLAGSRCIKLNNNESDYDLIIFITAKKKMSEQQRNEIENLIYSQLNWNIIWDKHKIKYDLKLRFSDADFSFFLDPHSIYLLGKDLQLNTNYKLFVQKNYLNNIKYIENLIKRSKRQTVTNYTKHSYLLYLLVNMYINKSTEITEEMHNTAKQIRETKSISKELFEDLLKKYEYIKETYNYLLA